MNETTNAAGYWSKAVARETERANRLDAELFELSALVADLRLLHQAIRFNDGRMGCEECHRSSPCPTRAMIDEIVTRKVTTS